MRIEPNEISDYDYINRKLREHAQELLKTAPHDTSSKASAAIM